MNKAIFLLFMMFVSTIVNAQIIKFEGSVYDSTAKKALPNATVVITGIKNLK